jgi:L-amino acid N-acyltransferase YncA
MIRPATAADAEPIARIYNHYVLRTIVTFEEEPVTTLDMAQRIEETLAAGLPWLVAEDAGHVLGFAYASKWKGRCAYRHSVEVTVYLDANAIGRGHGSHLYESLFAALRGKSLHVAIGGIALPNPASIALHERFGMQKIAHFREVGYKFGRWIDVGYWQSVL